MKKQLFLMLAILMLALNACKKDMLVVDQPKTYIAVRGNASPEMGAAMTITLKPDGKASLIMFGDTGMDGTYAIKGKKLKVSTGDGGGTLEFLIISETELFYKEYGARLILAK